VLDIWLLNGTRAMIDLEEDGRTSNQNPDTITCEVIFIEK
jgi:hypothetical protein